MESGYLLSYSLQEPFVSGRRKKKSERQDQGMEEEMVFHVESCEAPC